MSEMRNEPGFMDLRQWMDLLDREGELHRIAAPVTWAAAGSAVFAPAFPGLSITASASRVSSA